MLRQIDAKQRSYTPFDDERPMRVHAAAPDKAEQELLVERFGIPKELLRHALDIDEVARIDRKDGARLVLIRTALESPGSKVPVHIVPIGFILVEGSVVTISPMASDALDQLLLGVEVSPDDPMRGILELLLKTSEKFHGIVRDIDAAMERLERRLAHSQRNQEVLGLLAQQKALIQLETALSSNKLMLERVSKDANGDLSDEHRLLLDDVMVELQQALQMTKIQADELASTMDAFASIISNNLNVVMKRLTGFTMVLTVPMVIASFYGMNVRLPLEDHPAAFPILVGLSVALAAGMVVVFRRKNWL